VKGLVCTCFRAWRAAGRAGSKVGRYGDDSEILHPVKTVDILSVGIYVPLYDARFTSRCRQDVAGTTAVAVRCATSAATQNLGFDDVKDLASAAAVQLLVLPAGLSDFSYGYRLRVHTVYFSPISLSLHHLSSPLARNWLCFDSHLTPHLPPLTAEQPPAGEARHRLSPPWQP